MNHDNIYHAWERADAIDRAEGALAWQRYHAMLQHIAAHHAQPFPNVVAAFAALSPNSNYTGNLRSLLSVLTAQTPEDIHVSTYMHCGRRAWAYLHEGVDFLSTVKGPKIRNFYLNIVDPTDPQPVTIDGHMMNLWYGERLPLKARAATHTHYETIANDFRRVARTIRRRECSELTVGQLQATLWFTWKRIHRIGYNAQLGLFNIGDQWRTLRQLEEIRPF